MAFLRRFRATARIDGALTVAGIRFDLATPALWFHTALLSVIKDDKRRLLTGEVRPEPNRDGDANGTADSPHR